MRTAKARRHRAAQAIDRKSLGKTVEPETIPVIRTDKMRLDHYDKMDRQEPSAIDVDQHLGAVDVEVNRGLTADQVIEESRRCMSWPTPMRHHFDSPGPKKPLAIAQSQLHLRRSLAGKVGVSYAP